ncbi:SLAP domain-containing protein [Companilactobacillus sp. FL22-1]|uniref:SLAP domain-containing protein n=1 Tax=Companilactobacillus sp. FL22-1 TaxID=3373892 RepID=UPI0037545C49
MKTAKSVALLAALAIATIGGLATSQNDVSASGVATTTTQGPARLYTSTGSLITDRELAPNTKWAVGKTISINNETFYQVATNEYLKAADSSLDGSATQQPAQTALIGTVSTPSGTLTISKRSNDFSDTFLPQGSQWRIGKYIVNRLGKKYVQISNDDYVPISHMTFNHPLPEPTSDPDFYYYWQMDPNLNPGYTPHTDY